MRTTVAEDAPGRAPRTGQMRVVVTEVEVDALFRDEGRWPEPVVDSVVVAGELAADALFADRVSRYRSPAYRVKVLDGAG